MALIGLVPSGVDGNKIIINQDYVEAVLRAGGTPVLFPVTAGREEIGRLLDRVDGLVLTGGVDVDPARYGQENVACGETDEALDALQLAAVDAFVKAGRPVFGTCRGHQLLNVYFGGTLIQHLPQSPRHKWDDITDEVVERYSRLIHQAKNGRLSKKPRRLL